MHSRAARPQLHGPLKHALHVTTTTTLCCNMSDAATPEAPTPPAAGATQSATAAKGSPNDFLKKVIGKHVIVRLQSGVDYHGVLSCLDGFMNIALEETQEVVEGVPRQKYGDTFIRGNNVLYITAKE